MITSGLFFKQFMADPQTWGPLPGAMLPLDFSIYVDGVEYVEGMALESIGDDAFVVLRSGVFAPANSQNPAQAIPLVDAFEHWLHAHT